MRKPVDEVDKVYHLCRQNKEDDMLCHDCKEPIEIGEVCRAESVEPGSEKQRYFHLVCYYKVKRERQQEKPPKERKQGDHTW